MLSVTDIAAQLESIHRSIALDQQTIEIYKQAAGSAFVYHLPTYGCYCSRYYCN